MATTTLVQQEQEATNQPSPMNSPMKKQRTDDGFPGSPDQAEPVGNDGHTERQEWISSAPSRGRSYTEVCSVSSSQTNENGQASSQHGRESSSLSSTSSIAGETVQHNVFSLKRKQDKVQASEGDQQSESSTLCSTHDEESETEAQRQDEEEIKSIVSTSLWSDNSNQVASAMTTLCNLVAPNKSNSDENRMVAFRLGAPLAIVQAMRWYSNNAEIQRDACFALAGLSLCKQFPDAGQIIVETGGLELCLHALQQRRHHSEGAVGVQTAGCCLINNLCSSSPAVRRMVFLKGGLLAVLRAMATHQHHGRVQKIGCRAMNSLLLQSLEPTWIQASVDLGGIKVVLAAMSNHAPDAELQLLGCKFILAILAMRNASYFTRVVQAKGLVTMVQTQQIHKQNYRVYRATQSAIRIIEANFLLELAQTSSKQQV